MAILLALALLNASFSPRAAAQRPNVLLLTIDCLRADRLGCYGYGRPTSPGLDKLAAEGVLFADCTGQAGWTSPGLLSVLTGLYPEATGMRGRASVPPPGLPALPLLFKKAGYELPNLTYLTSLQNYWNLGYDPPTEDLMRPEEDRLLADFLEKPHTRPFFAWYHYRFLHLPYTPPEPWRGQFLRGDWPERGPARDRIQTVLDNVLLKRGSVAFESRDREIVSDLFDANVRRMDAYVSSVLASLERSGLSTNTIVVVTSDHGEELFERGFVGHSSTNFDGTLHEEILHVPLIVRAPGRIPAGGRVAGLCAQVDIAPTLVELADIPTPLDGFQGRSLVSRARGLPCTPPAAVFSSTTWAGYQTEEKDEQRGLEAVTTPEWRWIREVPSRRSWLFDRRQDRAEMQPLKGRPDVERKLAELAADHEAECSIRRLGFAAMERPAAASAVATGPEVAPTIEKPDREILDFDSSAGAIEIRLAAGTLGPFVAEYEIGTGVYRTAGTVSLAAGVQRFGPFSRELWRTLSLWNPWRFRVSRAAPAPVWSRWVEFKIEP